MEFPHSRLLHRRIVVAVCPCHGQGPGTTATMYGNVNGWFGRQHDDHESECRPVHQHERRARRTAQHEVDVVTPIGVIGLGLMGSALAERLLGAGHRVIGVCRIRGLGSDAGTDARPAVHGGSGRRRRVAQRGRARGRMLARQGPSGSGWRDGGGDQRRHPDAVATRATQVAHRRFLAVAVHDRRRARSAGPPGVVLPARIAGLARHSRT